MIKLVGSLLAFTALVVSIMSGVDPLTCLTRSAVAFAVGGAAGWLWSGIVSSVQAPKTAFSELEFIETAEADEAKPEGQMAA